MGTQMYQLLLDRYPNGNEADRALVHLATLACWSNDWNRALKLYEQLLQTYPKSRFVQHVREAEIPTIQRKLGRTANDKIVAENK